MPEVYERVQAYCLETYGAQLPHSAAVAVLKALANGTEMRHPLLREILFWLRGQVSA